MDRRKYHLLELNKSTVVSSDLVAVLETRRYFTKTIEIISKANYILDLSFGVPNKT